MGDKTSATNTGKTTRGKNEDGEFFSDEPSRNSLSKSLIALNKYVKKNLLYDEEDEYRDNGKDEAYFSKESTPNESVSKSDSESLKSNESFDSKNQIPYAEVTTFEEILDSPNIEKENIYKEAAYNGDQTNDYTSMQLLEKSENTPDQEKNVVKNSASLNDLTSTCENKNYKLKVKLREKPIDVKPEENRHTVHEFTEWGNRTTIYPDVYAPLPYSEYGLLFKSYCQTIFHASLTSDIHCHGNSIDIYLAMITNLVVINQEK